MPDEIIEQLPGTEQIPEQAPETEVPETPEQQPAPGAEQEAETDDQKNERVQREAAARTEKRARGVQKRMDELTREKYEERKRADELAGQNARLLDAVLQGRGQGTQQGIPQGEPKPEAFTDYNDYVRAVAKYTAAQEAKSIAESSARASNEAAQREAATRAANSAATLYAEHARQAAKDIPDFLEVMEDASSVNIPTPVLNMIRRMGREGPVIAYHMVKNPQLADQFFSQPAEMHGILLGQISATIKGPAKASNAPPPGKGVQAKPGSSSEPPLDADQYMAWAAKHMR